MAASNKWVTLQTRVPAEVKAVIDARVTVGRPVYQVVRDMLVAAAAGSGGELSDKTMMILKDAVQAAGYESIDNLVADLASSYMKVLRYHRGEIADNESSPDIDIIEMFSNCNIPNKYEKSISIRKRK